MEYSRSDNYSEGNSEQEYDYAYIKLVNYVNFIIFTQLHGLHEFPYRIFKGVGPSAEVIV